MRTRFIALALTAILIGLGCGFRPDAHLAAARQSVLDARYAGSPKLCPEFFAKAERHLAAAEKALAAGDEKKVLVEAQEAQHAADLARTCADEGLLPSIRKDLPRDRPPSVPPPVPAPPRP